MLVFVLVLVNILPNLTGAYHRFQPEHRSLKCECVTPDRCADEDAAFNGNGLLEPRIAMRTCPDADHVCCELPHDSAHEFPHTAEDTRETDENPSCGVSRTPALKTRITSDSETTAFGEFPWNVLVLHDGSHVCSGSLIHPKAVLTAAHCVAAYSDRAEELVVRAGEWDMMRTREPLPHQDIVVDEVLIHPDFRPETLWNDIAILVTTKSFKLRDNVGTICLSAESETVEKGCVASGWGKNVHHASGRYSSIPRKIYIDMVSHDLCAAILRSTRLGPQYTLDHSFVCAGGDKDRDACKGDGGAALACQVASTYQEKEEHVLRHVQVGIVSWGIGCGTQGLPGIYVNVAMFLDWIDGKLTDREMDPAFYRA